MTFIPYCKNHALWYKKEEIRRFKQDAAATLRDLREEGTVSDVEQLANNLVNNCAKTIPLLPDKVHGLEHMISYPVFKLIYLRKIEVIAQVLQEQEKQKKCGVFDESRLAQTSEHNSTFSKEWAFVIASERPA